MSPDTAQEVEFLLLDHRPPVDDGTSLALLQGTRRAAILHTAPPLKCGQGDDKGRCWCQRSDLHGYQQRVTTLHQCGVSGSLPPHFSHELSVPLLFKVIVWQLALIGSKEQF